MDGGRVLRALLAGRLGLLRGTRIAASLGQMLAVAGGLYGLFYGAPMLALVALFIFLGAGNETAAVETRVAGMGLHVGEMMVTHFRSVPVHASLGYAAELLLAGEQREFPVVDNLGRTEGLLTRDNLVRGLSHLGAQATVAEAMTVNAPSVTPASTFLEAVERLRTSGLPALLVVDGGGALVGLLTRDTINNVLLVQRSRAAAASRDS
jgi:stage IV sporulation protein FB